MKIGKVNWTSAQSDAIHARGRSIAVSAAAGSGKTAVLTRRIIEKVCDADGKGDLSRILVVTFTKTAASELVSRISDALSEELANNPANKHIREQSLRVSSAHISTIHSFCLDLIRTNFQKLGIPADFSAADETEMKLMMQSIAEELISDHFEDELRPNEEKIEDFAYFVDTFGDITRAEKLGETIIDIYQSLSSTVDFLDSIEKYRMQMEDALIHGFDGSPWEIAIREYLQSFLLHYQKIYADAMAYIAENDAIAKYEDAFGYDLAFVERALFYVQSGKSYAEIGEFLFTYMPPKLAVIRGLAKEGKLEFFKGARSEFSKGLRTIAATYYSYSEDAVKAALQGTAQALHDLSRFLHNFHKRFSEEKKRRHLITFGDMEHYALALLWDRKQDAPNELARSLQASYDEIYIDEYQDTNEIQDKIFTLISKEDNRFNVGDIKQSIYAFRGAESSIFSKLLDSRPKYTQACDASAVKIFLSENFRSTSEILAFCNGVFEKLMNVGETMYGDDERLNCGSGKHGDIPTIYLLPKEKKNKFEREEEQGEDAPATEADFIADKIANYLSGKKLANGMPIKPSDIVILLRSASTAAAVYENALKKRGIPCRNSAAIEFFESAEVLLVISFLSVIDNPFRDIYLAAALKSPLYGVTLDELLFIRRYQKDGSLFDALRAFTEEKHFAKGEKFLRDRERYAALAAEMPCDEIIWQIYHETGLFSIIASDKERAVYEIEQAKSNLITLYDYARNFERGGFKGLSGFISFINDVIAGKAKMDVSQFSSPGEVVDIMTIHKSKGLEFPICFLAGTSRRFHFPESKEKTVYNSRLGVTVKLPSESGMARMTTPLREASLLDLRYHAISEELRILYVALTRAKEKLFITASVDMDDAEEMLSPDGEFMLESKYFSEYALRHASHYFELIMASAVGREDLCHIEMPSLSQSMESPMPITAVSNNDVDDGVTYYEAKKLVHERLDFVYPYLRITKIPSKLSVSKLHPTVLDESEEGVEISSAAITPSMPNFLRREEDEIITASDRGTAMHTFMQFCDFELVREKGVRAEIDRLAEKQFIFHSDKAKMNVKKLERFFTSDLAKAIYRSDRVFRERRFILKFPAGLFTSIKDDPLLNEEKLLVQGVIDCAFFNEKNELILVDYKTDFFPKGTPREEVERTLRERHSQQLGYYRLACEHIFGVKPAHTLVYSFALDDTVDI